MKVSSRTIEAARVVRRGLVELYRQVQPHVAAGWRQGKHYIAQRREISRARAGEVIPSNAQFLGLRERQEDALACSDFSDKAFAAHGGYFAVLADGMGGYADGAQASKFAVQAMLTAYLAKSPEEPIAVALRRALDAAQVKLRERELSSESGTTIVAVVWHNLALQWISVGDSRAYVVCDNRLIQVTKDHNYGAILEQQVKGNLLRATVARQHPERDHLTSYVGGEVIAEIDISAAPFVLQPDDRVILCSDGVYRSLSEEELVSASMASRGRIAEAAIEAVKRKAVANQDNASLIGLCLPQPVFSRVRFVRLVAQPRVLFWVILLILLGIIWGASLKV